MELVPTAAHADTGLRIFSDLAGQGENSLVAIFGAFERKGQWTAPAELTAACVFGGGELDFTEAILTSQETTITATCIFGGLEITVPEGMAVRCEAVGVFGGSQAPTDSHAAGRSDAGDQGCRHLRRHRGEEAEAAQASRSHVRLTRARAEFRPAPAAAGPPRGARAPRAR